MLKYIIISFLFFLGCGNYSQNDWSKREREIANEKLEWNYKELNTLKKGILLYHKRAFGHSLTWYPDFFIIETTENDTIAILDKNFKGSINTGNKIKAYPDSWSDLEKTSWGTPYFKGKNEVKKVYNLIFSIDTVFYARVVLE